MAIPIISVEQMRDWENATWASGQNKAHVIARVGKWLAQRIGQLTRRDETILVLAGKGHNGDDARAALPHLTERRVILIDVLDPRDALEKFSIATQSTPNPQWVLDGLFGIGLNRPLTEDWQNLIAAVNTSKIPVLAIDVPSGMDADTGEVRGRAIEARITVTLAAPKRGLLAPDAIPYVGRLEVAPDIGLIPCSFSSDLNWTCADDFQNFPPLRNVTGHKGTYGHLNLVVGSLGYHGAAVLSASGAMRAQPGLVSVYTPENVYGPVASQLRAAMVHAWESAKELRGSAILFGPGLAARQLPETLKKEMVKVWEQSALPVVADASALDWLPSVKNFRTALRVLTPHPGEAARMLGISIKAVQSDRVSALRKLSARFGNCLIVLKGHQTLVGKSDGKIFVNSSGNPFLAQGGSGDVLAGYISGLLAQPALQEDAMKTVRFAVWQHGAAADWLSENKPNWTIDDLLPVLGGRF